MIIENQAAIARPAEEVFAFVADPRNDPKWHTDVLEVHRTDDGPVGAGSRFTRHVQIPARGLLRIIAPLMAPMARKEADRFLANLKRELEDRPQA